jgi:serine/threonine protein kinase
MHKVDLSQIPPPARKLTALGDLTTEALHGLFVGEQRSLFGPSQQVPDLSELATALDQASWSDEQAALLIEHYAGALREGRAVDLRLLTRWALAHPDDANSVKECMDLSPPEEISVIQLLSRRGSQKLVFLATWRLTQQEVVIKKLIQEAEGAERVLSRELQPHPLSMVHPNIIETHLLKNTAGEPFLVERRLPFVLNDSWRASGIHEASDLLFSIASALKFLHDNSLIHGDVKPDNIGKRNESYVLLDFGICRSRELFVASVTPTGSLRTRAPELLSEQEYSEPEKVDVWALGATVYNSLLGRFPLINPDEHVPRISNPTERQLFEEQLRDRVLNQWDRWVRLEEVPLPLRELLEKMLEPDPARRLSSSDVVEAAREELSAFLRSRAPQVQGSRFSPLEEFVQIKEFVEAGANLKLLPLARRLALKAKLDELQSARGFDVSQKTEMERLKEAVQS